MQVLHGKFVKSLTNRSGLNPHEIPPPSKPPLFSSSVNAAKSVGYVTCNWEGQHHISTQQSLLWILGRDTHIRHLGQSTSEMCVCFCVCETVRVLAVEQQRCYLTHPEKTSGEFKQPSHWFQLIPHTPTHTQISSCCTQTLGSISGHTRG